jgi:RNA polymerase sigma factor (sigma-70 family)
MTPSDPASAFAVQPEVRGPWRRYLDSLTPLRPELHRYCCSLTGNVWDGEDLAQDTLARVFSLLGKVDASLENPRAYLIRTATHLWIDGGRRRARERELLAAERPDAARPAQPPDPSQGAALRDAAGELLQRLAPRERAAVLLKDVFDLSLEETAAMLKTTVGAVKAALHRGRGRLETPDRDTPAGGPRPSRALVEGFVKALAAKDLDALRALCSEDLTVELVGGAELETFEGSRAFFEHAHLVIPQLGFGENPRCRRARSALPEPLALAGPGRLAVIRRERCAPLRAGVSPGNSHAYGSRQQASLPNSDPRPVRPRGKAPRSAFRLGPAHRQRTMAARPRSFVQGASLVNSS